MDKESIIKFAPLFYLVLIVSAPLLWNWLTRNKERHDDRIINDFKEIKADIKTISSTGVKSMNVIQLLQKDVNNLLSTTIDHERRIRTSEGIVYAVSTNTSGIKDLNVENVKIKDDINKNTRRIKRIEAKKIKGRE